MFHTSFNKFGFSLVEVMLVAAIIGIVASFILRVVFAPELIAWEDNLWRSLGISPALARLSIGSTAICLWGWLTFKKRSQKKQKGLLDL